MTAKKKEAKLWIVFASSNIGSTTIIVPIWKQAPTYTNTMIKFNCSLLLHAHVYTTPIITP